MPRGSLVIKNFAGVDLSVHPRELADDKLAWSENAYQVQPGEVGFRPQTEILENGYILDKEPTNVALAFWDDPASGKHFRFIWIDADGASLRGHCTLDIIQGGGSFVTVEQFLASGRPCFLRWRERLYVFPGWSKPGIVITGLDDQQTHGLAVSDIGTNWGTKLRPRTVWLYREHFLLAGMDSPDESTVWPCEYNDPDTLLASTKSWYLGRGDGDQIIHGIEVPVYGGSQVIEPYCVVWKRRSTWMIQGAPPTGATSGSISVIPINRYEGCVAKETVAVTEHGVIWCSGKNVWLMPPGEKPVPIGREIAPYISKLSPNAPHAWHAAYFNGIYRLTVPSHREAAPLSQAVGSAPEGHGSEFTALHRYPGGFSPTEQWWCDLREYVKPETPGKVTWWGPMTIPSCASAVETEGGVERLLMVQGELSADMVGAINGYWRLIEGDKQTQYHRDASYAALIGYESVTEQMELRFKEFDFGDPMLLKLIESMELHAYADALDGNDLPVALQIEMIGDGGSVAQTPTSPRVGGKGFVLDTGIPGVPAGVLGTGKLATEFQSLGMHPPSGGRFLAKTWQPVVRMPGNAAGAGASADLRIRALGVRVRPIGRRPTQ